MNDKLAKIDNAATKAELRQMLTDAVRNTGADLRPKPVVRREGNGQRLAPIRLWIVIVDRWF
jgi:hypothetical protein